MARYIDVEKAEVERISCFYGAECRLEDVQEWLNEQPTADVEEVKHAKWIPNASYKYHYYCSICGRSVSDITENPNIIFPYCHCGAKMDGGKEE